MSPRSRDAMRPSFAFELHTPSRKRAQGRPGARCTRGLVRKVHQENAHEHTGYRRNTPAFPAQWLYGLYVIVLVTGFLATILPEKRWLPTNLTPAPGRRTRTISPYANAAFVFAALASIASLPQRLRRWPTPLWWDRMAGVLRLICPTAQRKYFCAKGWTGFR